MAEKQAKKQVLVRMSEETYQRLQQISDLYGITASALIVSQINNLWKFEQTAAAVRRQYAEQLKNSSSSDDWEQSPDGSYRRR